MSGYFELIVDHDNLQIPVLFGIPKFHKNPVKMRYIAGAAKSTLKPLSILAYNVLSMLKTHFRNYCNIAEQRSNTKRYISINNCATVSDKLRTISKFNTAKSYDFSTLYTKLPHDAVMKCLFSLVERLYTNSGKQFIIA